MLTPFPSFSPLPFLTPFLQFIVARMVDFTKRSLLQQTLLRYYSISWIRIFNSTLYFIVQICLFVILTILPIKVTFNFELSQAQDVQNALDVSILIVFTLHVYLYLDHRVKKLVMNPEISKRVLFKRYVVKLKWLSILNTELIYDLVCLGIAIFQLIYDGQSSLARIIELIYLFKIYKIVMFHNRFLSYIIGTPFYLLYNIFYGLFILIIIVSYVGCAFFALDRALNNSNYSQPQLLWVNVSAWPDIINDGFNIQLLYTMYWSLGTASSAAYGNVSAGAPEDIIYNIICLYFEGFLFGFYLSRIHSLPEMLSRREDELLQIFEQFEQHKEEIKKNDRQEKLDRKLYFKILCSLEYQEARKKNVEEIQKMLPKEYLLEVKSYIFREMLHSNPAGLWGNEALQRRLSLKMAQRTTEAGQLLYDYSNISRTDIIYIKEGSITSGLLLDHSLLFHRVRQPFQFVGLFPFLTGLAPKELIGKCNNYCNLYVLKREDYKEVLQLEERVEFQAAGSRMLAMEVKQAVDEPLSLYEASLAEGGSDVLFVNATRKQTYTLRVLKEWSSKKAHHRREFTRGGLRAGKVVIRDLPKSRNVGIQCEEEDNLLGKMDRVIIS